MVYGCGCTAWSHGFPHTIYTVAHPIPSATNVWHGLAPWRPSPHRRWSDKIQPHKIVKMAKIWPKNPKTSEILGKSNMAVEFLMFFSWDLGTKLKTCNTYWPKVSGWHCATFLCFFFLRCDLQKAGMDRDGPRRTQLVMFTKQFTIRISEISLWSIPMISPWYPQWFWANQLSKKKWSLCLPKSEGQALSDPINLEDNDVLAMFVKVSWLPWLDLRRVCDDWLMVIDDWWLI